MKKIRKSIFETNSSSTHSLIFTGSKENYLPKSNKIVVKFANTDEDRNYATLSEKVSYLVSHIIHNYKYICENYEDLKEKVEENWEFRKLKSEVLELFGKEIVLPKTYNGDIEEIVIINHQLLENTLDDVLQDIVLYERDYIAEILDDSKTIHLSRD